MCGHFFLGYQSYQQLRHPQALWRCSVCGRQSHMPLDCCTHPDYHFCQPNGMVHAHIRRLGTLMNRIQTRIQSWLMRHWQPDVESIREDEQPMAHESLHALLPDMDGVSQHGDLAEETLEDMHDGARELQLR